MNLPTAVTVGQNLVLVREGYNIILLTIDRNLARAMLSTVTISL